MGYNHYNGGVPCSTGIHHGVVSRRNQKKQAKQSYQRFEQIYLDLSPDEQRAKLRNIVDYSRKNGLKSPELPYWLSTDIRNEVEQAGDINAWADTPSDPPISSSLNAQCQKYSQLQMKENTSMDMNLESTVEHVRNRKTHGSTCYCQKSVRTNTRRNIGTSSDNLQPLAPFVGNIEKQILHWVAHSILKQYKMPKIPRGASAELRRSIQAQGGILEWAKHQEGFIDILKQKAMNLGVTTQDIHNLLKRYRLEG